MDLNCSMPYTARVFTGKNNLAKAEGRREEGQKERKAGREREKGEKLKMHGSGFLS